jgi:hypothetical protein
MTIANPNVQHGVGFLPGGKSLKYGSSITVQFAKTRNPNVSHQIDEWCRLTGRSLHELALADHAFIIKKTFSDTYDVDFIKCRNRELVLEWCTLQWGEPGSDGAWDIAHTAKYSPYLFIRGEENMILFQMVWG